MILKFKILNNFLKKFIVSSLETIWNKRGARARKRIHAAGVQLKNCGSSLRTLSPVIKKLKTKFRQSSKLQNIQKLPKNLIRIQSSLIFLQMNFTMTKSCLPLIFFNRRRWFRSKFGKAAFSSVAIYLSCSTMFIAGKNSKSSSTASSTKLKMREISNSTK